MSETMTAYCSECERDTTWVKHVKHSIWTGDVKEVVWECMGCGTERSTSS